MNFDFDTLYNECRRESFTSGKELFYDDAVKNVRLAVVDGKSEIRAIVKGSPDVKTLIVFDEDGGLYDYECDCGEANPSHGPCAHVIASALSYEEKHPTATIEVTARKSDADVVKLVFDYNRKKSMKLMSVQYQEAP